MYGKRAGGKDGMEKFISRTPVAEAELFSIIDAMPLRQQEMAQRAKRNF